MQLNIYQQKVVNATDQNILCLSQAASGKTHVLTARVERLLNQGVHPSYMVAFTFTNQAAAEMKKRLGNKCKGMFIGTIHSYANKICNINNIDMTEAINKEEFNQIIKKALIIPKHRYPPVQYLFVDEFQDVDELQYEFIQYIPAKNRFYVGDERQFIYGFRGASDKFIRDISVDPSFQKYYLTANYRNPPNIMDFANSFLQTMNTISPSGLPVVFDNGIIEQEENFYELLEDIEWEKEKLGNWSILCRTNSELERAEDYIKEKKLPHVLVRRGDLDLEGLENILNEDNVKLMTIHSAKGLEFPNVIVTGAKTFNQEERRISYVAATRAKESLYWCPMIKKRLPNQPPPKEFNITKSKCNSNCIIEF